MTWSPVVYIKKWPNSKSTWVQMDQLMAFAWKAMVPLSFYLIVVTAIYLYFEWPWWTLTVMSSLGLLIVGYIIYSIMMAPVKKIADIKARQQRMKLERGKMEESVGVSTNVK